MRFPVLLKDKECRKMEIVSAYVYTVLRGVIPQQTAI
jgi:hypothetical protein